MLPNSSISFLADRAGKDNFVQYNISPFQQKHLNELAGIIESGADENLVSAIESRYQSRYFQLTESGRSALELALADLGLTGDDEVWIETTSNNFYISGCVTASIEKYCKWSRSYSANTKVILINHEFGFPMENISIYRDYNCPIIEDCAFSFLSQNSNMSVGRDSDYLIISFPKFMPISWGGGIYSKKPISSIEFSGKNELAKIVNYFSGQLNSFRRLRRRNYQQFSEFFGQYGILPRFDMQEHHTPGVFMFHTAISKIRANDMKKEMNSCGIQSSVFYGEQSYFIPCHHELDELDVSYIAHKTISIMRNYFDKE